MTRETPGTDQKALQINLDPGKYGTFAEIGAGQEVARWFFRVGGASGTIAKTISAYDMIVSDAIYGPCERYVSRQRLQSMLDHEYALLLERLAAKRGDTTKFFAFANTVAARSYSRHDEAHGWMGVKFQATPNTEPSEIIIHVRMLDKENVQEQETLGIIGQAFPIHIVGDGCPADLLNLFLSSREDCFLQLFDFPFLGQTHIDSALRAQVFRILFNFEGDVAEDAAALHHENHGFTWLECRHVQTKRLKRVYIHVVHRIDGHQQDVRDRGIRDHCANRQERFAETFAKWALGDIGVNLDIGYKVPPPSAPLETWGQPLARLAASA